MLDRFYQIVDNTEWLERFLPLGLKLVQVRIKDAESVVLKEQLSDAMKICKKFNSTLIINDYWQHAIDLKADFIHLGQEDLIEADLKAIKKAGIRLGISTHSDSELENAISYDPDYVALGPIYPTILKEMKWEPQGLDKIGVWKNRISCPLVAIGGITLERASGVFAAGANSICVATDVLMHENPESRISAWLESRNKWAVRDFN